MAYLDKTGLTHLWSKVKTALSSKADKTHTHTASDISGVALATHIHNYTDLDNLPNISKQGFTGGYNEENAWYFPLGKFQIDNAGNYGNFTFTGRMGGWSNGNVAVYSIMLMNRSDYSGDNITSTVSAMGSISSALNVVDFVINKNDDLSHTLYIKCKGYFCFDFAYTEFQHEIIYDGTYTTTAPSNIIW